MKEYNTKNKSTLAWILAVIILIIIYLYWSYNSAKIDIENKAMNKSQIDSTISNSSIPTTTSTTTSTATSMKNIKKVDQVNILPTNNTKSKMTTDNTKSIALITTNYGNIEIALDKNNAPNTVDNFIKLAKSGFYDGVRFHRVIKGFMIQTGDPQSKDLAKRDFWGTGGPGYKFADELTGKEKYEIGTVAMANSGPNTNGSQFFIMTSNTPLPPSYTVFGKVVSGQDIAMTIQDVKTGQADRPVEDVIIESVVVR